MVSVWFGENIHSEFYSDCELYRTGGDYICKKKKTATHISNISRKIRILLQCNFACD